MEARVEDGEEAHLQAQHLPAPPRLPLELSQAEHCACHSLSLVTLVGREGLSQASSIFSEKSMKGKKWGESGDRCRLSCRDRSWNTFTFYQQFGLVIDPKVDPS